MEFRVHVRTLGALSVCIQMCTVCTYISIACAVCAENKRNWKNQAYILDLPNVHFKECDGIFWKWPIGVDQVLLDQACSVITFINVLIFISIFSLHSAP